MKRLKTLQFLLALAALGLWGAGCASPDVNPQKARANTGYVDFHADPAGELWWEVLLFDGRTQNFESLFSELRPPRAGVLRLPFAPGHHRLQVTFLNRVIAMPLAVDVEVLDGRITPVRLTLTEAGTAQVRTESRSKGGTARGGYGWRTEIGSDESVKYGLSAEADPPIAYQVKEQMPMRVELLENGVTRAPGQVS